MPKVLTLLPIILKLQEVNHQIIKFNQLKEKSHLINFLVEIPKISCPSKTKHNHKTLKNVNFILITHSTNNQQQKSTLINPSAKNKK